jgi:hypothetical protein
MTIAFGVYGQEAALNYVTNKVTTTENLVYNLFATNVTPAHTDTYGTYTAAVGGGYGAITTTGSSWSISATGGVATAAYAQQTYTFTGALTTNATIYGYFTTGATNTTSEYFAEAFTSFTPASNGDNIKLTPQITAT